MDEAFAVILLVTGFCATAETTSYQLFENPRTWHEADSFCAADGMMLIQRDDVLLHSWANSGYSKAWIGLITNRSSWIQLDNKTATYFNWSQTQPDNTLAELCVTMTDLGDWYDRNCTELKQSVCSDGSHFTVEPMMKWEDAVMNCEAKKTTLVVIPDKNTNAKIRNLLSNNTEVWLGLHSYVDWIWSDTGVIFSSPNLKKSIDNFAGNELCAAMELQDGKLIEEPCDTLNPYICESMTEGTMTTDTANPNGFTEEPLTSSNTHSVGTTEEPLTSINTHSVGTTEEPLTSSNTHSVASNHQQSKKIVVLLKIETTANLEDPKISADLEKQLQAMIANQGVAKFKLAWKKLPGNP